MDKTLLVSLVALVAGILGASGVVDISEPERAALVENISTAVAAAGAAVASLRAIYLKAKNRA